MSVVRLLRLLELVAHFRLGTWTALGRGALVAAYLWRLWPSHEGNPVALVMKLGRWLGQLSSQGESKVKWGGVTYPVGEWGSSALMTR